MRTLDLVSFQINQERFEFDPRTSSDLEFSIQARSGAYDLQVSSHPFSESDLSLFLNSSPNSLLCVDRRVYELYPVFKKWPFDRTFLFDALESQKTMESVLCLVEKMGRLKLSRGDCVFAVGGGITQEVVGFAASIFKRGLPWIYFPTTLLSQCDSCIGGKLNLNFQGIKNQLAIVCPPSKIRVHTPFLNTLDLRDIHSGLGEILKSHIIGGEALFQKLERHWQSFLRFHENPKENGAFLAIAVFDSLSVKKVLVEADEFEEAGLRQALNLGHTLGHLIESASSHRIAHGVAVAMGIEVMSQWSYDLGYLSVSHRRRISTMVGSLFSKKDFSLVNWSFDYFGDAIRSDKKIRDQAISLVFLEAIGKIRVERKPLNDQFQKTLYEKARCFFEGETELPFPIGY